MGAGGAKTTPALGVDGTPPPPSCLGGWKGDTTEATKQASGKSTNTFKIIFKGPKRIQTILRTGQTCPLEEM